MNMKISGSGKIPSGEYNEISVSGNGRLYGLVRCTAFSSSGSAQGEDLVCFGNLRGSGTTVFAGNVTAEAVQVSGAFGCGGDLTVTNSLQASGNLKCDGSVSAHSLSVMGALHVATEIQAERIALRGTVACQGLLNAETIDIAFSGGSRVGSIGGGMVTIGWEHRWIPFRKFWASICSPDTGGLFCIAESVEGDTVVLQGVACPRVTGSRVTVGADCCIDLVQYTEAVTCHPNSKIGKIEKV